MSAVQKPFSSYNGGKEADGTYQKIISIFPPHNIYIEAFLGNGAILRKKKKAQYSIAIDKDAAVIEKWFNIHFPGLNLINTDAISFLKNFRVIAPILKAAGLDVLIYLDPPYPKNSRKNQKDLYRCEMTDAEHETLLSIAAGINANIVVSSYPNELYNTQLKSWNSFSFQSQTRAGTATEKVWFNYPIPGELHDYRYIGKDYRERERLKGIINRTVSKFNRMPDLHRNAILEQLKNKNLL